MLKIAICDDERQYLERIACLLQKNLQERGICGNVIEKYASGAELLEDKRLTDYDVVFLDINMPGMDGLQLAEEIRARKPDMIMVFITAFIDYAVEGYKVEAIRFLLKGMLEEALSECVEAVIKKLACQSYKIKGDRGREEILIADISYIESKGHKLFFYKRDNRESVYTDYRKLDEVEEELSHLGFLRIHKSFLVNVKYVSGIANYMVYMKDGLTLSVPRERFKAVRERYYEILGKLM